METVLYHRFGCPTAAAATALSGLGYTYTPSDFKEIKNVGVSCSIRNKFNSKYTISNYKNINNMETAKKEIIGSLQAGYPVIVHAEKPCMYTNSEHYFAFIDVNDDGTKVFVASGKSKLTNKDAWYDIDTAMNGINYWYEIKGV
jgi:hypothetical protein